MRHGYSVCPRRTPSSTRTWTRSRRNGGYAFDVEVRRSSRRVARWRYRGRGAGTRTDRRPFGAQVHTVRQQPVPVTYEDVRIDAGFRADLFVEDKVIVEIKSVELVAPVHKKQLLTYLRLTDRRLGEKVGISPAAA